MPSEPLTPLDLAVAEVISVPVSKPLVFQLTWRASEAQVDPVDMDIGCFYWARDQTRGAVQLVGRPVAPEPANEARLANGKTLMSISEDQVSGGSAGEKLLIHQPGEISFLVVHVSIYSGASDFRSTGAKVEVASNDRPLAEVILNSRSPGLYWCAVLVLGSKAKRLFMAHEERYFQSAYHADRHYGLGQQWGLGKKV